MTSRLKLRRSDGITYLERWGIECRFGGVFLHKMLAADPGKDSHDHPWWFCSMVLRGGYLETRTTMRDAHESVDERVPYSWRSLRTNELHRIIAVKKPTWTLVIHGPRVQDWGFKLATCWKGNAIRHPGGAWIQWQEYGQLGLRDLEEDVI
jgi:hypothetical protein